jgi:hypothetical protein
MHLFLKRDYALLRTRRIALKSVSGSKRRSGYYRKGVKMTNTPKKKLPAKKKILPESVPTLEHGNEMIGDAPTVEDRGAERPTPKPKAEAGPAVTLPKAATAKAERPSPPPMGNKPDPADFFRSQKPAADRQAGCTHCSWAGVLGDCKELELGSSKTGWAWLCPACGQVVESYSFVLIE